MVDPKTVQQAQRNYMEGRILSAHPVEIVHMLYHVAIDNLNLAIVHLNNGDTFGRSLAVSKAEEAVDELVLALDHSVNAPFTRTLADLYQYVLHQIIAGHSRQSEKSFREALSILTILSESWSEVKSRILGEAPAPELLQEHPVAKPAERVNDPYSAYSEDPPAAAASSRDWNG